MKLEFSRKVSEKYSYIKFHENLSSGSRVVPGGWTERRSDMAMLTVAFRNFVNSPKNCDWKAHVKIFCENTGVY